MASYNQSIINMLFDYQKEAEKEKEAFKVRAYKTAIRNIKDIGVPIKTIEDMNGVPGIGKKIKEKIERLMRDTSLESLAVERPTIDNVYGIGPATIKRFNEMGIQYVDQLKQQPELLNDKQRIGLEYWDDLQQRIPKSEMDDHHKALKRFLAGHRFSIVGSYRRKKESSGDIDVLVIGNKDTLKTIIDRMGNYIVAVLACKDKKFMGICRLGNNPARRIDILVTTPQEFPYAELYFTGSKEHNVKMRTKAKQMGYRLNEHGMSRIRDGVPEVPEMAGEEDIFRFLDIDYLEPQNR